MRKNFSFLIIPLAAILLIGGGAAHWQRTMDKFESDMDVAAAASDESAMNNPDAEEPAAGDAAPLQSFAAAEPAPAGAAQEPAPAEQAMPTPGVSAKDIHITTEGTDPKSPRSIGSLDAPVTITEYSSLTCPHCAHAHETILPQLIKDYVETGKVRMVFSDFPLNQQALDASKVSRCMASDQYFNFLTLLFSTIDQWAFSNSHPAALLQDAAMTGLAPEKAKACLEDKEVEAALLASMQLAGQKYQVSSTPTFVLNDGKKIIKGAVAYTEFQTAIDELLKEANTEPGVTPSSNDPTATPREPAPAPAPTPAPAKQ